MSDLSASIRKRKSDYTKAWRKRHPEKARALKNQWRKNNPEANKAARRRYYLKNKASIKERSKHWRKRNVERSKYRARNNHLSSKYGLTIDSFAAMLKGQDGKCAICRTDTGDWVVDHDHKTNDVRGILCRQCNIGLGSFKDSTDVLVNAAKYLLVR